MKDKEELIYDLIFSNNSRFEISIVDYTDVYRYDSFITEIKKILDKSKVRILSESLDMDTKNIIWKLKVKK